MYKVTCTSKPGSVFSSLSSDIAYAKKLLEKALDTNDVDYAWKLVDFLKDSTLLDQFDNIESY